MLFRHNEEDIPHWPIDLQYHIYQLSRSSQWRYDLCAHSSYPPIMTMSYFGRDLLAVEFPHRTYLYHDHLPIVSEHWWARTAELQNCRPVGIGHMHPYLFPLNQSRMDLFRHDNCAELTETPQWYSQHLCWKLGLSFDIRSEKDGPPTSRRYPHDIWKECWQWSLETSIVHKSISFNGATTNILLRIQWAVRFDRSQATSLVCAYILLTKLEITSRQNCILIVFATVRRLLFMWINLPLKKSRCSAEGSLSFAFPRLLKFYEFMIK